MATAENVRFTLLTSILLASFNLLATAQDTSQTGITRPNLFLDCNRCEESYLKENINIVNFVRNKDVAQIHLLVTRAQTGSGGTEYNLKFIGLGIFQGLTNTLVYNSSTTDTRQEEREGLARYVKLGLYPFISQTPLISQIGIEYNDIEASENIRQVDKWNLWVFEIDGSTSLSGEEQHSELELEGEIGVSRITNALKVELQADINYERSTFELEEESANEDSEFTVTRNSKGFEALVVKSLSPHWSIGGEAFISSSTFSNTKLRVGSAPAIEYNIFPYSEYNRHEFSFLYTISPTYFQYNDTTIFNKTEQFLIEQELSINYELIETWGSIEASVEGSTYLHDLSKNRVDIRTEFDFRIYRGFSVFVFGNYSLINNQIALPRGGASDREELLRLQELATGYEYSVGFGINFTFGSIFSNIVNPRFDNGRED